MIALLDPEKMACLYCKLGDQFSIVQELLTMHVSAQLSKDRVSNTVLSLIWGNRDPPFSYYSLSGFEPLVAYHIAVQFHYNMYTVLVQGHCWPREIPHNHHILLPGSNGQ